MSGVYVELRTNPATWVEPPGLIDLGRCGCTGEWQAPGVRVTWSRWRDSRQLTVFRRADRLLWVEGQPDRPPEEEEELTGWLEGRSGSFRGIEIRTGAGGRPHLRAFVDPLGTRPLYYLAAKDRFVISDKLATLALNSARPAAIRWPAVLESLTIGVLYPPDTSLENAGQLEPGQMIETGAGGGWTSRHFSLPAVAAMDPDAVRRDPAGALRQGMRIAVAETWRHTDSVLLLSGGLDSRFVLAVAGGGRGTLTVTSRENRESRIARLVAESCQAKFHHFLRPADHYFQVLRTSYLLTACLWEPWEAHHLGMAAEWRQAGAGGVVHAYHCDALLKGNRIFPRQACLPEATPLYSLMGDRAICYAQSRSFRWHPQTSELIYATLTAAGRDVVRERLRQLASTLEPVVEDGFELTVERQFLRRVSAGHSYPLLLGWMEELDVYSPMYHPVLWCWARASRPADRFRGRAFRQALLEMDHPACRIIDSNTGKPIAPAPKDWGRLVRNLPGLYLVRQWREKARQSRSRTTSGTDEEEGSWPLLAPLFRCPKGIEILEEGLACLPADLFDLNKGRRALEAFAAGDDRYLETVLGLSAAGRWTRFCKDGPTAEEQRFCRRPAPHPRSA